MQYNTNESGRYLYPTRNHIQMVHVSRDNITLSASPEREKVVLVMKATEALPLIDIN
jgi:hypothetical protein